MGKFSEMQFDDSEIVPVDMETMPDEFAPRDPVPQPGSGYHFQLPNIRLDNDNWESEEAEGYEGRFLVYNFRKNGQELVVAKAPLAEFVGNRVGWRVTATPKKWEDAPEEAGANSKLAYLFRDGLKITMPKNSPNSAWAKALVKASGRIFGATVSWNANCSKDRDIYVVDPETGAGEVVEGEKGCGQRYGQKFRKVTKGRNAGTTVEEFPKDPETGRFVERFECASVECRASISPFVDLSNFTFVEAVVGEAEGAAQPGDIDSRGKAQAAQPQAAAAPAQAPVAAQPAKAAAPPQAARPAAASPQGKPTGTAPSGRPAPPKATKRA